MKPIFDAPADATPGHIFEVGCLDLQLHSDHILLIGLWQIAAIPRSKIFGYALCIFVIDIDNLALTLTVYGGGIVDAVHGIESLGGAFLQQPKEQRTGLVIFNAYVVAIVNTADGHIV